MKLTALVVGLLLVASCEKSGTEAKSSGALSGEESSLIEYLPAGSTVLFGGNYMKFQNYLANSPLSKVMATLDKTSPGLSDWMKCWAEELPSVTMLGSVQLQSAGAEMRFVMKGLDLAALQKCSSKAHFTTVIDPDQKFMSYEMPSAMGTVKSGYLVLPGGALYSRQMIPIGGRMMPTAVDRAGLEADIAALKSGTAAKDTALVAAMAKVDRTKPMWFVGSGANTPASGKLGQVSGTFDIASGLALDVTAELKDGELAGKIVDGVDQAKKQADKLGGTVAEVIKSLQVTRTGDTLRFAISISNDQLMAVITQLGPMMGGLGGRR